MKETITQKSNFNNSGFDDDESVSSLNDTKRKTNGISNFLIKSHLTDSFNNMTKNNSNSFNVSKKESEPNIDKLKIEENNDNENNVISTKGFNSKGSINEEEEENIKTKETNELKTNLLIQEDDSIFFNFKDKLSKLSNVNDILRDTIKLSMKRNSRFNTSRLARTFIYEDIGKNSHSILKSQKFGIAKTNHIITYFLNLYIFSEFINFTNIEKDSRFKVYFIPKDNSKEKFILNNNIENILTHINIQIKDSEQFTSFINGLNNLLNDKEYNDIKKSNKKYSICLYIVLFILLLLISGISFAFYYFYQFIFEQEDLIKYSIIASSGVIALILVIILIFHIKKLCRKNLYINYKKLNYMLMNYNRFNDYIEEWNKTFFENKKIRASVPISVNYIMFNLDPYQDIEIKHLDMKWFIQSVYKDRKTIANDKEFIKYFIKVRSTLVESNTIKE